MGKTQKAECLGFSLAPPLAVVCRHPAKLDQSGLVRIQLQPKVGQARFQIFSELLRFSFVLKSHDDVIRVSDEHHRAPGFSPPPPVFPTGHSLLAQRSAFSPPQVAGLKGSCSGTRQRSAAVCAGLRASAVNKTLCALCVSAVNDILSVHRAPSSPSTL
jgi:hypothetical protein